MITNEEAIANISVLISSFFEDKGRDIIDDIEIGQSVLIEKIEDVIDNTNVSQKELIPLKLKLDLMSEKGKELFWSVDYT